ncbi:nitroreductase family deazaflavin-dependent oxidoreductase [Nocardia donostiensis]|uniref:Nitroreductase family deazaflavin-dependent oxidoreductase n=1 Tax=Nocardia donostiensis TaxID=1538463 RepID=A0A1W0BMB3_9NOCA|nr:nitroreductase family deazaflavin-dependent oxidoreductase [Nocardia donostiensis]ONM50176.1 nitroreductase family deazaflavin-dependent oxidoreductase [Nocardia donostiensis]OQS23643.1 nitroreductase family deazaflavin-dependent oxidoreductase [Nocardia donostiensis]
MVLPRALARFNRQVTNPVTGLVAGHLPGWGIVIHKGRNSGRAYRTPVMLFTRDGEYRIALTYGRDVDWVKNSLAAGGLAVETRGRVVQLTDPVVHHDPSASWAPPGVRQVLTGLSAEYYLEARAHA